MKEVTDLYNTKKVEIHNLEKSLEDKKGKEASIQVRSTPSYNNIAYILYMH